MDVLVHMRVRMHVEYQRDRVIHVQTCFNNTIVIVAEVRGLGRFFGLSEYLWIQGYKKRGMPFATQNVAGNAISTIVDQGQ